LYIQNIKIAFVEYFDVIRLLNA